MCRRCHRTGFQTPKLAIFQYCTRSTHVVVMINVLLLIIVIKWVIVVSYPVIVLLPSYFASEDIETSKAISSSPTSD